MDRTDAFGDMCKSEVGAQNEDDVKKLMVKSDMVKKAIVDNFKKLKAKVQSATKKAGSFREDVANHPVTLSILRKIFAGTGGGIGKFAGKRIELWDEEIPAQEACSKIHEWMFGTPEAAAKWTPYWAGQGIDIQLVDVVPDSDHPDVEPDEPEEEPGLIDDIMQFFEDSVPKPIKYQVLALAVRKRHTSGVMQPLQGHMWAQVR